MTYKGICNKIGFDPIADGYEYKYSGHEDDTQESPFLSLSIEELDFLYDYISKQKTDHEQ